MDDAINIDQQRAPLALVMGANGFMGSHITRLLAAQGRRVRAMVRPTSDLSALQDLDIEICHGDISDIDSVKAAMDGCGSVFYNVVDTRAWLVDSAPLYRTNVDGLANVLDAAVVENITRFVFTSSMVTLPRHSAPPAQEEHAFDWWDEAPEYVKTRVLAEKAVVDAVAERGLPAVMLCVANTYGPEDHGPTPHGNALWQATKSKSTALDCSLPTVDVRDAAKACLLAESKGRIGERYAIVSECLRQQDFYAMAAESMGYAKPSVLSMRKAYFFATIAEVINRFRGIKDAKFCRTSMFLSEAFGPMNHAKAAAELGWSPRPLSDTISDAIAWYRDRSQQLKQETP
ncbi:MAG: NAD-dependent epimerase/dehydratase family protein [Halieaceae bacterium]